MLEQLGRRCRVLPGHADHQFYFAPIFRFGPQFSGFKSQLILVIIIYGLIVRRVRRTTRRAAGTNFVNVCILCCKNFIFYVILL